MMVREFFFFFFSETQQKPIPKFSLDSLIATE